MRRQRAILVIGIDVSPNPAIETLDGWRARGTKLPGTLPKSRRRRSRGFALVVAIWVTGLLSLIAIAFATSVRVHVKVAANSVAIAEAEALADGGIELGIAAMIRQVRAGRPINRIPALTCSTPGGVLSIEIRDEAGRVDLNIASEALILALTSGAVPDRAAAARAADAILDYRDRDDDRREAGAERADYRTAGRGAPRNAPFQSADELGNVLGLDRSVADALRPHVTVRSGQDGVDPAVAT
ncbi:MAG: general secretion pathway protein GspK, partial [Hyphomicrobiaceae bacterium]|nr:general secretion pathway protein GspK [Hyphomicrobiaceae bacterium]